MATSAEREGLAAELTRKGRLDWRDVDTLARIGRPEAAAQEAGSSLALMRHE